MSYLSKLGYVHRDLAARNVLIDSDYTPKIADFGLSRETLENVYDVKTGGKIPVRWTAPEAILFRKFNMASDVWSYGVLMWEVMSYGKSPYGDVDNYTLLEQIQQGYRLEQPDDCPYLLYSLMLKCWDTVPEMRPTFSDLHFQVSTMVENNFKSKPKNRFSRSIAHSPLDFTTIEDWLTSLKMERYVNNFKKNRYSTMPSVWQQSEHDLLAIDISISNEQSYNQMGSNHLATIRDYNSEELNRPSHPTLQHPTIIHSTVPNEICGEEFWRQSRFERGC